MSPRRDRAMIDPLPGLRQQLRDEYGGSLSEEAIDLAVREALDAYAHARVREFVPVFAWRRARRRLRQYRTV